MNPSHESAVNPRVMPGVRRYTPRRSPVLLVVALAGSLLALLSTTAHAHDWGPSGLNGAQITVEKDGYNTSGFFGTMRTNVTGKGFKVDDVAQIFQCREGAVNIHRECELLGLARTDANGAFGPTDVVFSTLSFASARWGVTLCHNFFRSDNTPGGVQCTILAATFGLDLQPTSRAEHRICFEGNSDGTECVAPH